MEKVKIMDKLAWSAMQAKQRGMSYGQYMALPESERPSYKGYLTQMNALEESLMISKGKVLVVECALCGKTFITTRRHPKRYCSDVCVRLKNSERMRELYAKKKEAERLAKEKNEYTGVVFESR